MAPSIDGRIVTKRWHPEGHKRNPAYERLHDSFEADAWLIGRVTGQSFARGTPYPEFIGRKYDDGPRTDSPSSLPIYFMIADKILV